MANDKLRRADMTVELVARDPVTNEITPMGNQVVVVSGGGGGGGGDASAANQVIGNASLANIDGDLGAPADAAATTDTGAFSLIALVKRLLTRLNGIIKAEDAPYLANDQGIMALGVRNDANLPLADNDGDYLPIALDQTGRVSIGSQKFEDGAHTTGTTGIFVLGVRNDTGAVTTGSDSDYSQISVDSAGQIRIAAQRAEDSIHASGDPGVMSLAVRRDALTPLAADGDYIPLMTDQNGYLAVTDPPALVILNLLSRTEDAPHSTGERGIMSLGVRNDNQINLSSADGDYTPLAVDGAGRLISAIQKTEDAPHVSGVAGAFILGVRNDTAAAMTSADGDYSPLAVDSAGRLITPPSEVHIGEVTNNVVLVNVSLTVTTTAHANGDILADLQPIANALRVTNGTAEVMSVSLIDYDDQGTALDLVFSSANVSLGTENSPPTITDLDATSLLSFVPIVAGDYRDLGVNRIATVRNVGLVVAAEAGTTTLYIGAIVRGAATYAGGVIDVRIGLKRS